MSTLVIPPQWKKYAKKHCKTAKAKRTCPFCSSRSSTVISCDAIIADKNKPSKIITGKINDCIIFEQNRLFHIGVVEIKGKSYKMQKVLAQLCAGATLAHKILADMKNFPRPRIYLIVVARAHPPSELRMVPIIERSLSKMQYRFRIATCNDTFSSARKLPLRR